MTAIFKVAATICSVVSHPAPLSARVNLKVKTLLNNAFINMCIHVFYLNEIILKHVLLSFTAKKQKHDMVHVEIWLGGRAQDHRGPLAERKGPGL